MSSLLSGAWKARWNAVRFALAAFVLWAALADAPARLARRQLALLPDFDHAAEIVKLREQGRFGEALVIADMWLATTVDEAGRAVIERERAATRSEQSGFLRRAKDIVRGAITGGTPLSSSDTPPDASLEMFVGAIAADLFVVGDIRDLAIQAYRYAREGEADGVIVALSAVGIATTVAPEIDWAPSILKTARRAGAMTDRLGSWLVKAIKGGEARQVEALLTDTATIARSSSPAGTVRLLKSVDTPEDAAIIARFLSREGRAGAGALHVLGDEGAAALKRAESLRLAGKLDEAAAMDALVLKAAAKGERGASWLKSPAARALARPHPLVGALKGVYKGNVSGLVRRALEMLDPVGWWAIPVLAAWALFELLCLLRRLTYTPKPVQSRH